MTEASVQTIVTAFVGLATTLGVAWIAFKTKTLELEAKRVADAQSAQLKQIEETGEKIHVLVNAPMAAALLLAKVSTRRLWELSRDPADEAIYLRAEADYNDHIKRQAEVDVVQKQRIAADP